MTSRCCRTTLFKGENRYTFIIFALSNPWNMYFFIIIIDHLYNYIKNGVTGLHDTALSTFNLILCGFFLKCV